MARKKYYVSYVKPIESRFVGGDRQFTHQSEVISEHPVLWASRNGREIVFWSEIPEDVYQRASARAFQRALENGSRHG